MIVNSSVAPKFNWIRSKHGVICGVCSAFARQLDIAPWVIRLLWLLSVLALGSGVFFYFVLATSLPREDKIAKASKPRVFGVCYKLALGFDTDLGVVRALALLLFFASMGTTVFIYVILAMILPRPDLKANFVVSNS